MNARDRARRRWFQRGYLVIDWATRPAYSGEEMAATLLSDQELAEVLATEQREADQHAEATERRRRNGESR
jgi:hypothetical protein